MLSLAGIAWLFFSEAEQLVADDVWQRRVSQLRDVQLNPDQEIRPVLMVGGLPASGYFMETDTGFLYQGGLYDQPWQVGEVYSENEISGAKPLKAYDSPFFTFPLGKNSFYINIDRGDDGAVRGFLQVMDLQKSEELDTLIIDFRFLRTIEFSSMIRLFNQFAPRGKITFGKIINAHQEEVIKSTGQPFFSVNQTVFLVGPCVPAPVNRLIMSLVEFPTYDIIGKLGDATDTICLYTNYTIGPDTYRICTESWTGDSLYYQDSFSGHEVPDSVRMDMIRKMDEAWYKDQDSIRTKTVVSEMIDRLLP